eukprot:6186013-Pleurochrysis_carterae.AAC.7
MLGAEVIMKSSDASPELTTQTSGQISRSRGSVAVGYEYTMIIAQYRDVADDTYRYPRCYYRAVVTYAQLGLTS